MSWVAPELISEPTHWAERQADECWCMPVCIPTRGGDLWVHRTMEFETVHPSVFRHYSKKHEFVRGPFFDPLPLSSAFPIPWQNKKRRWGMLLGSRWIQAYF